MDLVSVKALLSQVESHYSTFTAFTKNNPVIGGMFGMWVLGVVSYFLRAVPNRVLSFIERYTTVTATLNNGHESFYDLLKWLENTGRVKKMRTIRLSNGRWGYDESTISLGLGTHYFWFNFRPFKLQRTASENAGSDRTKEEITVKTIGFSQKTLIKLIGATIPKKELKTRKIKMWSDSEWKYIQDLDARPIDSVVLKEGQKERIIDFIEEFNREKDWYQERGIPHRTGIILSGPPGTGKTSLVRALCGHLEKDLCIISCDSISDATFQKALGAAPANSLILLEDFDSIESTKDRELEPKEKGLLSFGRITLSGMLNAIDGVFSGNGRIIIATTNHLEKLDEALIRPGRFDLKEKLDYADESMVLRLFKKFFPKYEINKINISEKISIAQIENCMLRYKKDPMRALKAIEGLKYKEKNIEKSTFKQLMELNTNTEEKNKTPEKIAEE